MLFLGESKYSKISCLVALPVVGILYRPLKTYAFTWLLTDDLTFSILHDKLHMNHNNMQYIIREYCCFSHSECAHF